MYIKKIVKTSVLQMEENKITWRAKVLNMVKWQQQETVISNVYTI